MRRTTKPERPCTPCSTGPREGCGPATRSARLAHDDELADFLCGAQDEIVGEARQLLAQRAAE